MGTRNRNTYLTLDKAETNYYKDRNNTKEEITACSSNERLDQTLWQILNSKNLVFIIQAGGFYFSNQAIIHFSPPRYNEKGVSLSQLPKTAQDQDWYSSREWAQAI